MADMKKFFIKLILLSTLIFVMSRVLGLLIYPSLNLTPWSWGSEIIDQKKNWLNEHRDDYNMLVIGSSRVYRQVDPEILDSLVIAPEKIKSFNFGVNWLFIPETFYVYDNLVKKEELKYNYVIIEISKIRSIDFANFYTTRTKYWTNFSNTIFAIKAIWSSNFAIHEKVATVLSYSVNYLSNLINLGYFTEAFSYTTNKSLYAGFPDMGEQKNGYNTLTTQPIGSSLSKEENTEARHKKFLSDTSVVTNRLSMSTRQFDKFEKNPQLLNRYNTYYANHINKMIDDAKKNGTHLVFLMSPRVDLNQYNELIPLFNNIQPAHRIEISDGRKYPELYLAANSFDETHLNTEGAKIYTTILATKMNELIKMEQK